MKKVFSVLILSVCCIVFAFSQANTRKPVLAVFPFYGGTPGEGDTIANLIMNEIARDTSFTDVFDLVTRSSTALAAISEEHNFQMSGYTDSDAIAGIGRLLAAGYVISGSIRRLGDKQLLIATVIHVESYEQVAGLYQTYEDIPELVYFIPSISKKLTDAVRQRDILQRDSLAIPPFTAHIERITAQDAETLAEILAIELLQTGRYVILPRRTTMLATAQAEQDFQMSGYTEDNFARIGNAINAGFVLNGNIGRLGTQAYFTAQILNVRGGHVVLGSHQSFTDISEGIHLLPELAIKLTDSDPTSAQSQIDRMRQTRAAEEAELRRQIDRMRQARATEEARERRRQAKEDRRQARIATREQVAQERDATRSIRDMEAQERKVARARTLVDITNNAKRTELEFFSASFLFDGNNNKGLKFMAFLSGAYWSPLPFFNIGIEPSVTMFGIFPDSDGNFDPKVFYSIAPSIGTVLPIGTGVRVFANFAVDIGHLPGRGGFWHRDFSSEYYSLGISPGLNAGFSFGRRGTFNIKYSCTWNENATVHSAGIGFGKRY